MSYEQSFLRTESFSPPSYVTCARNRSANLRALFGPKSASQLAVRSSLLLGRISISVVCLFVKLSSECKFEPSSKSSFVHTKIEVRTQLLLCFTASFTAPFGLQTSHLQAKSSRVASAALNAASALCCNFAEQIF